MAHSHTPCNRCVRFVFGIAAASRNTRFQAARYGLPSRPGELPSGPGELHPEPLTDSGLDTLASSGSCHRAKAAAFHSNTGFFPLPVDPIPNAMACSLRSTGITPASSL